nr:MAG TPA: hypothetical protein [Caudoviricetes sp.]
MAFNLSEIISGIKVATKAVDIPLNMEDAERFTELVELAKTASMVEFDTARSITDTAPGAEFKEELERLRKETLTFRLRALSSKELSVLRRKAFTDPAFSMKNLSQDEREVREAEREDRFMEYVVAQACVEVIDNSTGETKKGLSFDEAAELRGALPEFLWRAVYDTWNRAQGLGGTVYEAISDPTFRGDGAVEEGESVDALAPEGSESGE